MVEDSILSEFKERVRRRSTPTLRVPIADNPPCKPAALDRVEVAERKARCACLAAAFAVVLLLILAVTR